MDTFSTEILLKIFSYLSLKDLAHLRQTCKRFKAIINKWNVVLLADIDTLVTNQKSEQFLKRCPTALSRWEKRRVAFNWERGVFKQWHLLGVRQRYLPWMHLNANDLWISRGATVTQYERKGSFVKVSKPGRSICSIDNTMDIAKFVLKNNRLVCGLRDGGIWVYSLSESAFIADKFPCHRSDVDSADISVDGNVICSGGRDSYFKIWSGDLDFVPLYEKDLNERVWCVRLNDELNNYVAIGLAMNRFLNSLAIFDMNAMTFITDSWPARCSNGILDIKWDSAHTFFSVGYDACIRKWDLRTNDLLWAQNDPFDNSMYCLDCDNYNSVVVGNQLHSTVTLWDVRLLKRPVQIYFMDQKSPVYCVTFDATGMFALTDRYLNVLNFSIYDISWQRDFHNNF